MTNAIICIHCGNEAVDPTGDSKFDGTQWIHGAACFQCALDQHKKDQDEEAKRGIAAATKVQEAYGLSNNQSASEIKDPYLRELVQAMLNYYNSWSDGSGTKYYERSLDRASEALHKAGRGHLVRKVVF